MTYTWQLPQYRDRFYEAASGKLHLIDEVRRRTLCGKTVSGGAYFYPVETPMCRRCTSMAKAYGVKPK